MSQILNAEKIFKIYKSKAGEVNAVNGITLHLEEGISYAIIGKSGSGKSTLLHILGGLDRPTSGEIRIDGINISSYSDEKMAIFRRRHMGFIFQQFNLLEDYSVKNNICMPMQLDGKKVDERFFEEIVNTLHMKELL